MKPANHHPSSRPSSFFDEHVRVVSYCPLCDSNYNLMEAKILEQRDDAQLVYIRCQKCSSSILALMLAHPLGVSTVGVLTDLSVDEVYHYRTATAVSEDDVLTTYKDLQNCDSVLYFCR